MVGVVRICSFLLPSATEIIAELGLIESLVGVSEECRWPAEVGGLPAVTAARIDPSELSSVEIDEAVRASLRDGRSLYTVDAELVAELAPDVIVTQEPVRRVRGVERRACVGVPGRRGGDLPRSADVR